MGQIIGPDQIAIPSHSAGTIILPPSLLTLGGRQYRTSTLSRLIATDVALAANTLYFVYAQIVGGIPVLRVSATAPSIYKIANPTANLVSAFHTVQGSTFGCFVPIVGSPPWKELSKQYGILEIKTTHAGNFQVSPGANNWGEPDGAYRISPAESILYDFETVNMFYHSGGGTLHARLYNFTAGTTVLFLGAFYCGSAYAEQVKIEGATVSIPAGNSLGIQMSPSTYIGGAPTSVGFYNAMNLLQNYMKLTKRMSATPLKDL